MSELLETAKKLNEAWATQNEKLFRSVTHADYSFQGPMMNFKSVDEAVDAMKNCPFECKNENCNVIEQGNTLVHEFDWVVTAPFETRIPMVEVIDFEEGKVKNCRLYYDSALFPEEAKQAMCSTTSNS